MGSNNFYADIYSVFSINKFEQLLLLTYYTTIESNYVIHTFTEILAKISDSTLEIKRNRCRLNSSGCSRLDKCPA